MEKETLTLYKIRRDLNRKIFRESIMLVCVFLVILLLFWILQKMKSSDSTILLDMIFSVILVGIFVVTAVLQTVKTLKFIINVRRNKFVIESDQLISKEEKFDGTLILASQNGLLSILFYLIHKDKNVYRLYFKRNDRFELPFQKSYRWSSQYSMLPKDIYITSDAGDTFTVVRMKNEVLFVYNNKYFEPAPNLR